MDVQALSKSRDSYSPIEFLKDSIHSVPFLVIHLGCLLVFVAGFSWTALAVCVALYFVRMFGITAGFHRYFSHRTYKMSRPVQLLMAILATSAAQRGPLWWAAHHRHHHRHSDTKDDVHSPVLYGLIWSHIGWIFSRHSAGTDEKEVRDLLAFPELRLLDKLHMFVPAALGVALFTGGWYLHEYVPGLGVNGTQMLAWGFFVSTMLLYHGTFTINSLSHVFGYRTYNTTDDSRNNWLLALVTLGEGWHNNHHRYPAAERQGFYWWEFDITHMVLRTMSWVRVVRDLKEPPAQILEEGRGRTRQAA